MESAELSLFGLAIVFFSWWWVNWFVHIVAILYAKWKLHRHHTNVITDDLPGISILKPLMGIDGNLYENLETFFNMKYPEYELLFCLQDEHDAARMIVQSLMEKYPKVDAKLFLGGKNVGVNPKINNMITGYEAAKHDLIVISDSGIKMAEDTLLDMKLAMTEKVGMVHQMPYVCTRKNFASNAEKVYFGCHFAKMYLMSDILRINSTTGMSCLLRKEVLEEAGGLKWFGQYLAEDYFMAQAFIDRGWRVRICSHLAKQNSGTCSVPQFHQRICRWMKLRNAMVPTTVLLEPLALCMVLGLLASWAANFLFDISPLSFFLVHLLVWFLMDYIMIGVLENGPVPFSKFEYIVGWFMNEICYLYLLVQSHWDPKISWRGRKFKLKWGGSVEELFTKQTV